MKKSILYSIAFVAMMSVACQKTEQPEQVSQNENNGPVFTAGIAAVKTSLTIDGDAGKVAWVAGDMITVTDAAGTSALYVAETSDAVTTFVPVEGQPVLGAGPYSAKYGGENHDGVILKKQNYSSTNDLQYLTMLAESDNTSFTFNVTCGVLSLRLVGDGITVKTIMLKGPSTDLYYLYCGDGIDITSGQTFRMCFNPGLYKKIYLTDANNKTCIFTLADDYELELKKNEVTPAKITDIVASQFDCIYLGSRVNGESNNYPVCWAECNIGAEHCYDAGYVFQWGETTGYAFTTKWRPNGDDNKPSYQFKETNTIVESISIDNDAARAYLGGTWRLPLATETAKLTKYTVPNEWIENYNETGMPGVKITGETGATLFIPAYGYYGKNSGKTAAANTGFYWINNSTYSSGKRPAIKVGNSVSKYVTNQEGTAYYGFAIRPVKD